MSPLLKKPSLQKATRTEEEKLIDQISESLTELASFNPSLVEKLRSDLLTLRSRVSESDFTNRYLKSREKALQQFIDQFPSMLGYWNKDLINVHCNQAYAGYFCKTPEDFRGKHAKEALGQRVYEMSYGYMLAVLKGEPQKFERVIHTRTGVMTALASYVPHFVDDEVAGFFVIVSDVTEKKSLELRNRNLEKSLYEQSRLSSLGQMASGIAHEINNPVTIIYSNACLLIKDLKKDEFNKDVVLNRLAEIEATAERIEKIIDGLRSVSLGSGGAALESQNLIEVIDQVVSISRGRFLRAGLEIHWKKPSIDLFVMCNSIQISEILLNLLNNAFDALEKRSYGSVSIEVETVDDECKVIVSDTGPSIPSEIREKIFLPFFTTKGKEGTGLGLKISRDLAVANNGSLTLSDDKKTKFVLSLERASPFDHKTSV